LRDDRTTAWLYEAGGRAVWTAAGEPWWRLPAGCEGGLLAAGGVREECGMAASAVFVDGCAS